MLEDIVFWAYADPITGQYSTVASTGELVLFDSEDTGRKYEPYSFTLRSRIGHFVTVSDANEIAKRQTDGQIAIIKENS